MTVHRKAPTIPNLGTGPGSLLILSTSCGVNSPWPASTSPLDASTSHPAADDATACCARARPTGGKRPREFSDLFFGVSGVQPSPRVLRQHPLLPLLLLLPLQAPRASTCCGVAPRMPICVESARRHGERVVSAAAAVLALELASLVQQRRAWARRPPRRGAVQLDARGARGPRVALNFVRRLCCLECPLSRFNGLPRRLKRSESFARAPRRERGLSAPEA